MGREQAAQMVREVLAAHMEQRAESKALAAQYVEEGHLAQIAEFERHQRRLEQEDEFLLQQYEKQFPGFKATDEGMDFKDN